VAQSKYWQLNARLAFYFTSPVSLRSLHCWKQYECSFTTRNKWTKCTKF